jgi:hypothetical protein
MAMTQGEDRTTAVGLVTPRRNAMPQFSACTRRLAGLLIIGIATHAPAGPARAVADDSLPSDGAVSCPIPPRGLRADTRAGHDTPLVITADDGRVIPARFNCDYDAQTGNIFAAVARDDYWVILFSEDDGDSFTQTLEWHGTDIIDIDLAVVGDWAYLLYADGSAASELRLRRFNVADGQVDNAYGTKVVCDVAPQDIREVAIVSNADDSDNGLYCFALSSGNAIRYLWSNSSGGIFTDASPSAGNVLGGLDAHWNDNADTYFLFMSYIGMDGNLHIWRRGNGAWNECYMTSFTGDSVRTALTAYEDTVFCVVEHAHPAATGIRGYVNYAAGGGMWYANTVYEPADADDGAALPDTTGRGGGGIAVVYRREAYTLDDLEFVQRHTYDYSPWSNPSSVASADPGSWTFVNWLPPLGGGHNPYGYGVLYERNGSVYFHRRDGYEAQPGDNCATAIPVDLSQPLPFTDSNTTCGRANDYSGTIMGDYDEGEDIVYAIHNPGNAALFDITLTADTSWAGMALFEQCMSFPSDCFALAAGPQNPDIISMIPIVNGMSYLMVDTYPPPDCTSFQLTIDAHPFAEVCPGEALYCQEPYQPVPGWSAWISDWHWSDGYLRRFDLYDVTEDISVVRWWGFAMRFTSNSWVPCDENPMTFAIAFYQDYGGLPGDPYLIEQIEVLATDTGYTYSMYDIELPLYRFEATLSSPCALRHGWASIVGVSQPDECWFGWLTSPDGNGRSVASYNGAMEIEYDDLAFALLPADPCPEDLNGDGLRDLADLGILLASFDVDGGGDIDGDGDTDLADLGALLAVWDVPCD